MTLLRLENVTKTFQRGSGPVVHAVNGVSFELAAGETLALIGESGSGKSTVGRLALGLLPVTSGTVEFDGKDLNRVSAKELRSLRPQMQIVFQEPYQSLNPRMRVGDTVAEPLLIHRPDLSRSERWEQVKDAFDHVGLPFDAANRYPRALSGGQQQRVGIARAIVTKPRLVVLDEPTSSLDLSVRAQILNLLSKLQEEYGLSYLFISHDIATVRHISRRVAVMYLGQLVETGPAEMVMEDPVHPYTRALLSATLSPDPNEKQPHYPLVGDIPDPTSLPPGCFLVGRCPLATAECAAQPVPLRPVGNGRQAACIKLDEVAETAEAVETPPVALDSEVQ